jgi:GrpB-like predicted nucleotidyltransferase (UPF0157 family)
MPSKYTFSPYSADWPVQFQQEAKRLYELLKEDILVIHHVGSTAIPGLAAKPIIDLLPIVSDIVAIETKTPQLEAAGYKAWGEAGIPGRRYFTKDTSGYRTHNIHIFEQDNPEVERHLAFCAYLRAHEQICKEYEMLKQKVYAEHPDDIMAYNAGKDAWIKALEPVAIAWYREQPQ